MIYVRRKENISFHPHLPEREVEYTLVNIGFLFNVKISDLKKNTILELKLKMEGFTWQANVSLLGNPQTNSNHDFELEEQDDSEATLSSDEVCEAFATIEALEILKKTCEGNIAKSIEDLGVWEKYIESVTVKVEDNLGRFG